MRVLKSQTDCLQAAVAMFRKVHGNEPFTMDAVATWSMANDLYPAPKRGDPKAAFEQYAAKLDSIERAGRR